VIQTPEQQVYLSKLLGYDFKIQFKSGKSNVVADALSRVDTPSQCLTLTMPHFLFLEDLKKSLHTLPEFTTLHHNISTDLTIHPDFTIHQGLIFF